MTSKKYIIEVMGYVNRRMTAQYLKKIAERFREGLRRNHPQNWAEVGTWKEAVDETIEERGGGRK